MDRAVPTVRSLGDDPRGRAMFIGLCLLRSLREIFFMFIVPIVSIVFIVVIVS